MSASRVEKLNLQLLMELQIFNDLEICISKVIQFRANYYIKSIHNKICIGNYMFKVIILIFRLFNART